MVTMIPVAIEIRFVVAALVSIVGAVACFGYVATNQRRKAKKPTYLAAGIGFLYMLVIYTAGALGSTNYLLRSGWLTIFGLVYLAGVYVANVVADWRVNGDN